MRLSLAVVGLLALAAGLAVLNNNVSLARRSRSDFDKSLDRSLAASAGWTTEQFSSNASGELVATDLGLEFVTNPALLHMFVDSCGDLGRSAASGSELEDCRRIPQESAGFDRKAG